MRTHPDHNQYMREYMRQYRKKQAEERQAVKAEAQGKIEALLTGILETLARIEAALAKVTVKALMLMQGANVNESATALAPTETNVKGGNPTDKKPVKRGTAVFTGEPEQANVNINGDTVMDLDPEIRALIQSPGDSPARRAALADYARALLNRGVSRPKIAGQWNAEQIPTRTGEGHWNRDKVRQLIGEGQA
jgi:hypothetical protein